jgi:hypothetical protein
MEFFPKHWISDPQIRVLTPELRGALVNFLAVAATFPDRKMPNDPALLADLLGARSKRRVRRWLKQLKPFIAKEDEVSIEFRAIDAFKHR